MKYLLPLCISLIITTNIYSQDTLILQPGPPDGRDAIVQSLTPDHPNNASPNLLAASWTYGGDYGVTRGLFQFNNNSIILNIENLPPGIYVIFVYSENNKCQKKLIVIE